MENEQEKLVKKRKLKSRLGALALCVAVAGVSAGSIWMYLSTRQNDGGQDEQMRGRQGMGGDMVTATGTTTVGVDAVTFEIDFLEDTSLYVEEVYLSNGDTVAAGDKYVRFTDESIKEARQELESMALNADLSYRSSVITNEESKIQAKYEYDVAMLEAGYAQQVYDDTIAALDAELAASKKAYDEAQETYDEYYDKVTNNTFYEDYEIEKLKKAYEDALDLYQNRLEYWDIDEDELESASQSTDKMSASETAAAMPLTAVKTTGTRVMTASALTRVSYGGLKLISTAEDTETPEDTSTDEGSSEDMSSDDSAPSKPGGPKEFGAQSRDMETPAAQADRKWILKAVTLLEEEYEEAKAEYEQAQEDYQTEINGAALKLELLANALETAREDYTDTSLKHQKESLSAKTTYETAVAKGQTAGNDYDTQLTSLADSLERLKDEKEDADENLALFEELVGDGYLYTENAGTVLMIRAEEGQALTGGDIILAYSNADELSVSVSVSQDDIAKLTVGEAAQIIFEEQGTYEGVIETINPVSSSDSRTSVTYTVTVAIDGDVSALSSNLTATVIFGEMPEGGMPDMGENMEKGMSEGEMPEGKMPDMGEMPEGGMPDRSGRN